MGYLFRGIIRFHDHLPHFSNGLLTLDTASTTYYTITNVGTLPSGTFATTRAINSRGEVAGVGDTTGGQQHGFIFAGGTLTDLGHLGGGFSDAFAINDDNPSQAAGYTTVTDGTRRAFYYAGGTMTNLGRLPGGTETLGRGMNNSGQIVGRGTINSGADNRAFRTGADGALPLVNLDTLQGNLASGGFSDAADINNSGRVVGMSQIAGGLTRAFRTAANSAINPATDNLGVLAGHDFSEALALNDDGGVVGRSQNSGTGARRGFFWNGSMLDLGTLSGGSYSDAFGINSAESVVGIARTSGGADRAVLWTDTNSDQVPEAASILDLNTRIPPASGWVLQAAVGINAAGQITGYGTYAGQSRSFILTPNAP